MSLSHPAEGHVSGSSPLKAHIVTHRTPTALQGGNLSKRASVQAEKEKRV